MFSLYMTVLFAHVIAALLLTGHSFFAPMLRRAIEAADSLPALRSALALDRKAGAANPAISMLLLASGIYLGSSGWWYAGWFYVSVALWIVNTALAMTVVQRISSRLDRVVTAAKLNGISFAAESLRRSRAWSLAGRVMLANDVAILFVMLAKPEPLQSIAVVVVANAIGVALLFVRTADGAQPDLASDQVAETELAA